MLHIQTTAQDKLPGESCRVSGIFIMHFGKTKQKTCKEAVFSKVSSIQVSIFLKQAQDLEIRSPKDPLRNKHFCTWYVCF